MRAPKLLLPFAAILLLSCAGVTVHGQELVDNPEYKSWSSFEKGTSVTRDMTANAAGRVIKSQMTLTLESLSGEAAIVTQATVVEVGGMKVTAQNQKQTIPAKISKAKADEFEKARVKKGEETLKIAGKEYQCIKFDTVYEQQNLKMKAMLWYCEQIPGGMAKLEADGGNLFKLSAEVSAIDAK